MSSGRRSWSPGETLRALLDVHGYTGNRAAELLGATDPELSPDEQRMLWLGRAAAAANVKANRSLSILLRLFLLMEPVSTGELARRFPRGDLGKLVALGVLKEREGFFHGTAQISLHRGLRILSDRDPLFHGRARPDIVFGPTNATMVLDQLTPRQPVARALDLGCGTGYLALRLAAHADEVVATDVEPRAVDFTGVNADLNGCPQLITVVSDRFSALPGQRFGLITGNLPFVISPERRFVYRDADEAFVPRLLGEVGDHLEHAGWAFLLAQWPMFVGAQADDVLGRWLAGTGLDALILCSEREPVDRYAARWSAGPSARNFDERKERYGSWMEHYERERIGGVGTGLFVLRAARGRKPRLWCEDCADLPLWSGVQAKARFEALSGVRREARSRRPAPRKKR